MIIGQIIALLYIESDTATYSRQGADIKAESDIVTEYDTVIKETESQTSGEKPMEKPTENVTEKPTEKPTDTSGMEKVTISGGTQAMTKGITGKKCQRYIDTRNGK